VRERERAGAEVIHQKQKAIVSNQRATVEWSNHNSWTCWTKSIWISITYDEAFSFLDLLLQCETEYSLEICVHTHVVRVCF
jgi:hypothetical protein